MKLRKGQRLLRIFPWAAALLLFAGAAVLGASYSRVRAQRLAEAAVTPAPTKAPPAIHAEPTEPLLRAGSIGIEVVRLQERLRQLGFYSGDADGQFGSATQRAVTLFQEHHRLEADGMAGARTLEALYAPSAQRMPEETPSPAPMGPVGVDRRPWRG